MEFQAPKGTRDFYPKQMAWQNFLFDAWRRVSIRNGFEQIDGPVIELLDLYQVKSGGEMVGQAFRVRHPETEDEQFAIRPEFTPTLARMVAEQANALPKPIKWFSIPNVCRAERPQRGRLREHWQWNLDIIGLDSMTADAEAIFAAVDLMQELGLGPEHVRVKISHRQTIAHVLGKLGVADDKMVNAFELLDKRDKIDAQAFSQGAVKLGLDGNRLDRFDQTCRMKYAAGQLHLLRQQIGIEEDLQDLENLDEKLTAFGIAPWCEYDLGIVRGFAYYTGTVFEIHETSGAERAIAGGGRYDNLIELFGGPKMSAVGFGMGDVVISLVLADKGLKPEDVSPRPHAFIIAEGADMAGQVTKLAGQLRKQGLHIRFSYKSTRNMGKLLKEADAAHARYAVIINEQIQQDLVNLKDLDSGTQSQVNASQLPDLLQANNTG